MSTLVIILGGLVIVGLFIFLKRKKIAKWIDENMSFGG